MHTGKAKAVALEADFAASRVHAAFKVLASEMSLTGCNPCLLGSCAGLMAATQQISRKRQTSEKQHFQELLNCHRPVQPPVRKWVHEQQHVTSQDPPSDEVPTLPEIAAAVSALKNYKAAGVCGISPEMIKYGGQDGLKMLHILISRVWHEGVVPEY